MSNSRLGLGYTWNAPPFRAVEGYTSFLWVFLLDVIWRVTGVEPPESANVVSLAFAYGTTAVAALMLLRMELRPALQRVRLVLLALVLLGMITNRTYLTWTSSGLETAMFNFFVTVWVFACLYVPTGSRRWLGGMSLSAALAALTRPDGILLIAATFLLAGLSLLGELRLRRFTWWSLLPLAPLIAPGVHLAWRKWYYGEWLPNTAAAKYVSPWPESGARYLLSFVIEYALWFWVALVVLAVLRRLHKGLRMHGSRQPRPPLSYPRVSSRLIAAVVVGTLLIHFAYYTLVIGGDHFEYRVYSHLVPLVLLSAVWFLNDLNASALPALAFLGLFVLCALPIPWAHWSVTHTLDTRQETLKMRVPVAPLFPAVVRPYVRFFDGLQSWLISHSVCIRHQEHKVFWLETTQNSPSREVGALLSASDQPTIVAASVGIIGWTLPTASIIDALGLNDRVIARNPVDPHAFREMAHDRRAPAGYLPCFQPNLRVIPSNKIVVAERKVTGIDVADCENRSWPAEHSEAEQGIADVNLQLAPEVDDYLWNVWPTEPLLLYYVPAEQNAAETNRALVGSVKEYPGAICLVVPPQDRSSGKQEYMFAFLPAAGRPTLGDLARLFPWVRFVSDRADEAPSQWNLGYAAPAGAECEPRPEPPRTAVWANDVTLLGWGAARDQYQPGDKVTIALYYLIADPGKLGQNVFVHLEGSCCNPDTGSVVWAQHDGELCRGLFPTDRLRRGTVVVSQVVLTVPPTAPRGVYQLVTGFYDWKTGERVPVLAGSATSDSIQLGQIVVGE